MRKKLKSDFFNRNTIKVAKDLLGKYLVAGNGREIKITEVEVYDGFNDDASHAIKGLTPRNKIMFDHPGLFYIYLIYGIHYMLNIVTREKGYPAAILIRGGICNNSKINGPAKVAKYLDIDKRFNALKPSFKNRLWLEDRGDVVDLKSSKRIGINYASKYWRNRRLRFFI